MTDNTVAKIAQGALVVSLKNAKTPTVWRARLENLDEASFKIETAGKGAYSLKLLRFGGKTTAKAGAEEIAVFTTKAAAEQALGTITDVLFNMDDVAAAPAPESEDKAMLAAPAPHAAATAPTTAAPVQARSMKGWRIFYWLVFALIFMVLLVFVLIGSRTYSVGDLGSGGLPDLPNSQTMGGDLEDMPDLPEGRLRSADDFFQERDGR